MTKWLKFSFLLAVSSVFVACGGSSEKKAQDRAEDMTTEYNRLVKEMNASSLPSDSWTEDQLVKYEAKLDRMAYLKTQLDSADGKNGVTIIGGDNSTFISQRKALIRKIRAQKSQATQRPETSPVEQTTDSVAKIQRLNREARALRTEMRAMGSPSVSWSYEDLSAYESKVMVVLSKYGEMNAAISLLPMSDAKTQLYKSVRDLETLSSAELRLVRSLIILKKAA